MYAPHPHPQLVDPSPETSTPRRARRTGVRDRADRAKEHRPRESAPDQQSLGGKGRGGTGGTGTLCLLAAAAAVCRSAPGRNQKAERKKPQAVARTRDEGRKLQDVVLELRGVWEYPPSWTVDNDMRGNPVSTRTLRGSRRFGCVSGQCPDVLDEPKLKILSDVVTALFLLLANAKRDVFGCVTVFMT